MFLENGGENGGAIYAKDAQNKLSRKCDVPGKQRRVWWCTDAVSECISTILLKLVL